MVSSIKQLVSYIQSNREVYPFEGVGITSKSCAVTTIECKDKVFMIFSDLDNGTSVTDAIPQLVNEIYTLRYSALPPESVYVLQHYGELRQSKFKTELAEKHKLEFTPREDEFQLLILKWDGKAFVSPKWKKMKSAEIVELIPDISSI